MEKIKCCEDCKFYDFICIPQDYELSCWVKNTTTECNCSEKNKDSTAKKLKDLTDSTANKSMDNSYLDFLQEIQEFFNNDKHINPDHYKKGYPMEVCEMSLLIWGKEKYMAHCEITAFEYRLRAGKKEGQPAEKGQQQGGDHPGPLGAGGQPGGERRDGGGGQGVFHTNRVVAAYFQTKSTVIPASKASRASLLTS
jgi:hypothetical protein